jgi:hypothetical protein
MTGPYVAGSLAEPLTAALFVLGLGYALATWRDVRSRGLLVSFAIAVIVTGGFSSHNYVPVQRLHYAFPVVALLAALAADRTGRVLAALSPLWNKAGVRIGMGVLLIGLVTASNLYRWFVQTPKLISVNPMSLVIRTIELPRCREAKLPPIVVNVGIPGDFRGSIEPRHTVALPEFAVYDGPQTWLESADSRCVLFTEPSDAGARELIEKMEARHPQSHSVEESGGSGEIRIRVYYPSAAR